MNTNEINSDGLVLIYLTINLTSKNHSLSCNLCIIRCHWKNYTTYEIIEL